MLSLFNSKKLKLGFNFKINRDRIDRKKRERKKMDRQIKFGLF